jgi:DNA-binding NtrC family response regulator
MPARILLVDDEKDILKALEFLLRADGYSVASASSAEEALGLLGKGGFDIMLTDLKMPGMGGMLLLEEARRVCPELSVVLMTAYGTVESAVEAMKKGAADYIMKPFINEDIRITVKRLIEQKKLRDENLALRRELAQHRGKSRELVFISESMGRIFETLESIIPTKSNVLLTGESGTGKGVIAEFIHYSSPRRDAPFISINCSAIPEGLLESELFGYRRGAFTGANSDKKGLIELAHSGTLFMDEIGDMPGPLQAKLLKVLESGDVMALGETRVRHVDIRLISATNQELEKRIKEGAFREDLYYRLSVFEINVPPLRERVEDIPPLVDFFIGKYAAANKKHIKDISPDALAAVTHYPWPGNVRELSNVLERAVVLCKDESVGLKDLPDKVIFPRGGEPASGLKQALGNLEKEIILKAYEASRHNKEATANNLSIDLATLYRKLKKFGIE